jgi:hypothetical protein
MVMKMTKAEAIMLLEIEYELEKCRTLIKTIDLMLGAARGEDQTEGKEESSHGKN